METIKWSSGVVITVDQTMLPSKLVYLRLKTPKEIAKAIKRLSIRGAPLLGAAAALALAQAAYRSKAKTVNYLFRELTRTAAIIKTTRPTAVNLFNSIDTILKEVRDYSGDARSFRTFIIKRCLAMVQKDAEVNAELSRRGTKLISYRDTLLTHCNAGELATVRYGTALGVIMNAHRQGKKIKVINTETRPLLQGARLTTFELRRKKIPTTLITDNMVGYVMQKGMINKVILGADRILTSGHVINKVGTYIIAVLAKKHRIPFYVAAPTSTIDIEGSVRNITIEERNSEEVLEFQGIRIAAKGVSVLNPAFDITPPHLVTRIITEKGIIAPTPKEIRSVLK